MTRILLSALCISLIASPSISEEAFPLKFSFFTMQRHNDSNIVLLTDGAPNPGIPLVTTDDLDNELSFGFELEQRIEAFGVPSAIRATIVPNRSSEFRNGALASSAGGISVASADLAGSGIFGPITNLGASVDQEDSLYGLEFNADVYSTPSITFTAGLRAMKFDEGLTIDLDAGPSGFAGSGLVHHQHISNEMVGPQIGFRARSTKAFYGFEFSMFGKLAYVNNTSEYQFNRTGRGLLAGATTAATNVTTSNWTGVAELGVNAVYAMSEASNLSLGLNLLYFDSVGTTAASLRNTSFPAGTGSVTRDSVLYSGLSVGWKMKF
jgi:hypothetical protein